MELVHRMLFDQVEQALHYTLAGQKRIDDLLCRAVSASQLFSSRVMLAIFHVCTLVDKSGCEGGGVVEQEVSARTLAQKMARMRRATVGSTRDRSNRSNVSVSLPQLATGNVQQTSGKC